MSWYLFTDRGQQVWKLLPGKQEEEIPFDKTNPNSGDRVYRRQALASFKPLHLPTSSYPSLGLPTFPPSSLAAHCVSANLSALHYYSYLQMSDGHWPGDYGGPMFLMPGALITCYITGVLQTWPREKLSAITRYILNHQHDDGGWGLHIEAPSTQFGTVMNYVALRILGLPPSHPALLKPRAFLLAHGGAYTAPSWCKFWLCVLNVFDWSGYNSVFPEFWLLPETMPIHPWRWWCHCLTGDHMVLTRSGWRSLKRVRIGDVVMSFNVNTNQVEWKRVTMVVSHRRNPRDVQDELYRMQGVGMDVVATRGHRMLVARLKQGKLHKGMPIVYETVEQLLSPHKYKPSRSSTRTRFAHSQSRAVVRAGLNRQPSIKIVIPGIQRVCDWWWTNDEQLGFLKFLGFWLGHGTLDITRGRVLITQRKLESTAWLIDLLDHVFPHWWYRCVNKADGKGTAYDYYIPCPPLFEFLRVMAVGPLGYDPKDPSALRSYPHFTSHAGLRAQEQHSRYYKPVGVTSRWTEDEMLAAMSRDLRRRYCVVCCGAACGAADRIARAHPGCVDVQVGSAWFCPDCAQEDVGSSEDSEDGDEDVSGKGHWFSLKRWMGQDNMTNVFSKLSREQAIALLDGFCRADATYQSVHYDSTGEGEPKGTWVCTNSSFPLIDHLQLIAQLAEASVTLKLGDRGRTTRTIDGLRVVTQGVDRWRLELAFSKDKDMPVRAAPLAQPVHVSTDIEARGHYDYEDDDHVYCIEVEDNGNFLTQRLAGNRLAKQGGGLNVHAQPVFVGNCRMVYLPMAYLYAEKFQAPVDPLILALRAELYSESYESIAWSRHRDHVAAIDLYIPQTRTLKLLNFLANSYERFHSRRLRRSAASFMLRYIEAEDDQTKSIDIGPVNKFINMLSIYHAHGPAHPRFHAHVSRVDDYFWLAEDGMKCQGYNGSQLWDTAFATQAIVESGMGHAFESVVQAAYHYLEITQVQEDVQQRVEFYRHLSNGAWPFSTLDHGWPITDCTGEGMKATLAVHSLGLVKELITEERLARAVHCVLTFQNDDGGWATYENHRAGGWMEWLNPAEVFAGIMVDYSYCECTSASMTALVAFSARYPEHRALEISAAVQKGAEFLKRSQREDGSWYGSWAVCFTYGTWFGVEGLMAAGEGAGSAAVRKALRWVASTQKADGGWGESYQSCVQKVHVEHEHSQVVNTAWALLTLMRGGWQGDESVIERGIRLLLQRQTNQGDWEQEAISGVFNGNCMITYSNYRNIFPMWAIGRYVQRCNDRQAAAAADQ